MIAKVEDGVVTVRDGRAQVTMTVKELAELARMVCPREELEEDEAWIGSEDVSAIFGISDSTARTWMREGRIPAVRVGKKWLTRRSDAIAAREGRA